MSAIVEARGLRKTYRGGDAADVDVLTDVNLTVHRGEVVAVVGPSGAGKSTLLHLLGALDIPSGGEIVLDGHSYPSMTPLELDVLRNQKIGFVFQFHHLLREFTALENVMMPLLIGGTDARRARSRAEEVLASVDLAGALVTDPKVLLADEPSGNLDEANADRLHDLLFDLARDLETALVLVTHNRSLADRCDRTVLLANGRLEPATITEATS